MRRNKFGAVKTEVDGITFDSKAEARYYGQLRLLERAGEIRSLRLQVPFELAPAVVLGGRKRPALRYLADFVYETQTGVTVVADVKGAITESYRIKRHLMKALHGIEVQEVRV